jgi:hypothetical protein
VARSGCGWGSSTDPFSPNGSVAFVMKDMFRPAAPAKSDIAIPAALRNKDDRLSKGRGKNKFRL